MKHILCDLCGNSSYYQVYKNPSQPVVAASERYAISETHLSKPDSIVRCMTCDLVYAVPDNGSFEPLIRSYTAMVDHDYVGEAEGRRLQARRILQKIAKYKRQGRLLDVGCGPGLFLDEAKKKGWDVQGLDLSGWAAEYAKDHFGVQVTTGTLLDAHFPDRSFDVIVMNDVIEHVENPKAVLSEIRRILKNDGVLYLSTPDIESVWSRFLGARWWGINKFHLFYFSRKTLEKMFHTVGFKSLRYSSYPRSFSYRYWSKRLDAYPSLISKPFSWGVRLMGLGEKLFTVDLHDQLGVVAKKIQRLDSVITDDEEVAPNAKKSKVIVVLPAYNAEKTLERTVRDIPKNTVDEIILVDDKSSDATVAIAKKLGLVVYEHSKNRGYGGNQKTCYRRALERGADIVVMVHPDYQYDPKIIPKLIEPIAKGHAEAVFGSRMMKGGALEGGMPLWKHNANILLTAFENVVLGTYLTEYHSGFRAYSAELLRKIRYEENSDNFIFDTEIIVQILANRLKIEEVPIRTRYFEEASSIRFWPSVVYGIGILGVMLRFWLHKRGLLKYSKLEPAGKS